MENISQNKESKEFLSELTYIPYFNLALQQNNHPIVYELKLSNFTGEDIEELTCRFSSVPGIIHEKTISVNKIKNAEELSLDNIGLELDYDYLSQLSESVKGKLKLTVQNNKKIFYDNEFEFEAFAPDQWLGTDSMPELLASFVTPNLEVITHLQSSAARELERATGNPDIQGYQADKTRVYEICAAIYRAIHNWGIRYSNPAASFGVPGQRIRFADTVFQYKLGTCLDTAILFASVMEACLLHPVIIIQKGHAYVGCHLADRYFADIPMDDLQTIRKLADLDEFLVIETTSVTQEVSFEEAEAAARANHLNIDKDFEFAIDIVRARYSGIHPLPLKRSINGVVFEPVDRHIEKQIAENARQLEKELDLSTLSTEKTQPARIIRWTSKLLDLSLRNRLLNVRDTKFVIPLACPDITILEDKIADNETLSLNALSNLLGEKDLHDLNMLRNNKVTTEVKDLLTKELAQQRLWTYLSQSETQHRLTALFRQGKTDMEEGGVNTLYLAIGFLEWKVTENDSKTHLAPILLLPIRLQRKSIVEGIRISRIDGETIVNETLLELLRSQYHLNIPGLSPLPVDSSGVDVGRIMQIFRQSIKNMKGWEVRQEAKIGHFSFGKFVMWNDMTARLDVLKETPLIKHLITGSGIFDDGIEVFPPEKINEHLNLAGLYCPVSADSSQLTAVLYSEMGKNFVLHGPPGTGKSQTITNIIAHNLALGKRVLFVSEKKAALDVVHKRLSQIGLKPFCLELHSNKSGKSEVLAQFNEALQTADCRIPEEWSQTVSDLTTLRTALDDYVRELHHQYPNGYSAYDCFSHLLSRKEKQVSPEITVEKDLLSQSHEDRIGNRRTFTELVTVRNTVDTESILALELIDSFQWSPVTENNLRTAAKELLDAINDLNRKMSVTAIFDLQDLKEIYKIYQTALLLKTIKKCKDIPGPFFCNDFQEKMNFISSFAAHAKTMTSLKKQLQQYHLERFKEYDFSGISERISQNEASFFPIRFFKNMFLLKELSPLKKNGGIKLSFPELKNLIPEAQKYIESEQQYHSGKEKAANLLGKQWDGEETEWDDLENKIKETEEILNYVQEISGRNNDAKENILKKLQDLMPEISKKCSPDSRFCDEINSMLNAWNVFQEKQQAFIQYSSRITCITDTEVLRKATKKIIENISSLRNVLRYRTLQTEINNAGWKNLADMLQQAPESENFVEFYDMQFFKNMLNQILNTSPLLCQFSGNVQDERIKTFSEFDTKYMSLTRKLIFAKLAEKLPRRRTGPCPEGTELGLLKRECEKRARQKPIRQLLEQIPNLVQTLKPCFLMSPLSVAQYLPADSSPFDLIVFDEASQIPVWDAIGVIARGKQLIVVGDPKQMPPTNFFQKNENTDDEDTSADDMEDLESILDECIAAGIHPTYLNWHYRSRHESLIAFSNHHYYDDRLFTFPAARNTEKLGIRFEFVQDGVYDRKATRTNPKEAEALVKYIFDRLERSGGKYRSIGVVTFSQAQQILIEDLIEKERVKHPALEECFSDTLEESLFVKNLENVQGDERDVILFSIGYAPDANGKFSMNFGPLNRQGGERRLNVAITRAKEQVVVFSSIHANQIDLSRTNAVGAAHLKYFLEYAEKKINIYSAVTNEIQQDGLRETIAEFLIRKGYQVEQNIGCSGFRIDIAVRHPDKPEDFLLGIECDNSSYAAQNTSRDRDNLRHQVLRGLGWHTYRAWCVDWTFDRQHAEQTLLDYIQEIRNVKPEQPAEKQPASQKAENNIMNSEEQSSADTSLQDSSENRKEYQIWENHYTADQNQFYEFSGKKIIKQQIAEIIEQEAPIYEQLLKKRIIKAWGFNRSGDNIQKILESCMPQNMKTTKYGEGKVYWAADQSPEQYTFYRVGTSGETTRSIDEIPPEELANAMYEILIDFSSCEKDSLYRETVKRFGFAVVTAKARKFLDLGLSVLQRSGKI